MERDVLPLPVPAEPRVLLPLSIAALPLPCFEIVPSRLQSQSIPSSSSLNLLSSLSLIPRLSPLSAFSLAFSFSFLQDEDPRQ
jgi:hypothetical protein